MKENPLLKLNDTELKNILCPYGIIPAAWNFTPDELREAIKWNRLLNVSIDPSWTCNLNCPYCYTAKGSSREKKDTLTFNDYKKLIPELKKAWTRTINIIGEWEPTLYPDLEKLLRLISDNDIQICLVSNWIVLASNDKLLDLLKELDVTICLKLNSFNSKIQDSLVGMWGYTILRDKALKKIIEKWFNNKVPTRLAVNTLLLKPIYEEFNYIFRYCRENNIALISSLYIPSWRTADWNFHWESAIKDGTSENLFQPLTRDEIRQLLSMINNYDKEHRINRSSNPAYITWIPCTQLLGFQIDGSGYIWSCPSRKLITKNWEIVDEKITQIKITQLNAKNLLDLRKECTVRWLYTWKCLYKNDNNKFTQ